MSTRIPTLSILGLALAPASAAAEPPPDPLTMDWTVQELLRTHPAEQAAAARARAAAAGPEEELGLPDPMLMVEGWPAYRFGVGAEMFMFTLRQDLPLGGARSLGAAARRQEAGAARADAVGVRLDIVLAGRLAFLRLAAAETTRARLEEELALARQTADAVRARVSAGAGAASAALSAAFVVTEAESALATARGEERAARAALVALLGRPAGARLPRTAGLLLPPEPPPVADLVARALGRAPAIRALDRRRTAAEVRARSARARIAPMVTLSAGYMLDVMEPDGVMATIGVSVPIFPGARDAAARESRETALALRADGATVERQLAAEIASTREALVAARARIAIVHERLVPQALAHHQLAMVEYARGQTDLLGLLDAVRHHLASRLEEVQSIAEAARLQALLDRATAAPATGEPR